MVEHERSGFASAEQSHNFILRCAVQWLVAVDKRMIERECSRRAVPAMGMQLVACCSAVAGWIVGKYMHEHDPMILRVRSDRSGRQTECSRSSVSRVQYADHQRR